MVVAIAAPIIAAPSGPSAARATRGTRGPSRSVSAEMISAAAAGSTENASPPGTRLSTMPTNAAPE